MYRFVQNDECTLRRTTGRQVEGDILLINRHFVDGGGLKSYAHLDNALVTTKLWLKLEAGSQGTCPLSENFCIAALSARPRTRLLRLRLQQSWFNAPDIVSTVKKTRRLTNRVLPRSLNTAPLTKELPRLSPLARLGPIRNRGTL